ncbi:MAG: rRNA pseudouridine synthase [Bacteroidia bacterium]|nr:rRNA pseudouridine synthase [Bacteroidia bacterium]
MAKKGNFDKFISKGKPEKKSPPEKRKKKADPKPARKPAGAKAIKSQSLASNEPVRLNKYIALAGICSRRDADALIAEGKVKVNGKVVTEMGMKIDPAIDKVVYQGKSLIPQNFTYFLMNKPKNHITTLSDEQGRKTVMDIITIYTSERVFPVGRLDRNTTGLLVFTNDGQLAEKMTHPSYQVKKVYHVSLDQPLQEVHALALQQGIKLEDGVAKVDRIDLVEGHGPTEIGVEIHSGKNRIVRRMFEHLGYQVLRLDRVAIGPLTKKNLPRGRCRPLTEKEVSFLRMIK